MSTEKKVVLVTGANKGIGKEIARELAQKGMHVVLTARDAEAGEAVRADFVRQGLDVEFLPLDITQPLTMEWVKDAMELSYGKLDILINNAGILPDEDNSAHAVPIATMESVLKTNTLGPLALTQALLPLLKKGTLPQVINVSSGWGQIGDLEGGYPSAYKLSKAALNLLTIMLADELKNDGIAVNAVCPGWVRTDMGGASATRSVEQGAFGIVWLAMADKDTLPTGQFLRDGKPIPW